MISLEVINLFNTGEHTKRNLYSNAFCFFIEVTITCLLVVFKAYQYYGLAYLVVIGICTYHIFSENRAMTFTAFLCIFQLQLFAARRRCYRPRVRVSIFSRYYSDRSQYCLTEPSSIHRNETAHLFMAP